MWAWLIGGAAAVVVLASMSRKQKQRAAVTALRKHFPPIARMRLVGACPGLDPVLDNRILEKLFDWMLAELYRRTDSSDFGALMRWSIEHGELEACDVTDAVMLGAVDRLPAPALEVIDGCNGRAYAALMIELALNDAGHRVTPELNGKYV